MSVIEEEEKKSYLFYVLLMLLSTCKWLIYNCDTIVMQMSEIIRLLYKS